MSDADDILFGREGGLATVTLNRPQALNAFTLGMYRRFDPMLQAWAEDPGVRAVVIRAAEGRAFCAGGDIRAIYEAGRGISGEASLTADFFREEYRLIRRIHRYSKPYIALIDGITMAAAPVFRSTAAIGWRPSARRWRCRRPASGCFPTSVRRAF